jgi:outer membrane receptor protein involved in Fe transport
VTASTRGYFGGNTTAGTRLSSNIADLASSVTVVTKEFMADFNLLDINDVFMYEAGTEGLSQYTHYETNMDGQITDLSTQDPNNANRVRGIGAVNRTFGNFEMSGVVPIDSINNDGMEISRGPNSSIFGIGNVAGTINAIPATANVSKNKTQVAGRADSLGGYRSTIDVNTVLIRRKLAIRGSAVYQKQGFNLKPSGVYTNLLNGMVQYRPNRRTVFNAFISKYRMHGVRANNMPPSDGITQWKQVGEPSYNPVTNMVTLADGSVLTRTQAVSQRLVRNNTSGAMQFYVDQGRLEYVMMRQAVDPFDPAVNISGGRQFLETRLQEDYTGQPLFRTNSMVSDSSIYDWNRHNIASSDYSSIDAQTSLLTFDQVIIHTPLHQLAVQAGWFREQSDSFSRVAYGISRTGGSDPTTSLLTVDLNTHLLDGTPNPYYGRPYISVLPYVRKQFSERDSYRMQLAYRLNPRTLDGAWRWLGTHNIVGYGEYKEISVRSARGRYAILSDHSWYPDNVARGGYAIGGMGTAPSNFAPGMMRIYVGDAQGQNVEYAPSFFSDGSSVFEWGTADAGWTSEPVYVDATYLMNNTGAGSNKRQIIKTAGTILQSYFLDDRVITTFGWRHDEQFDTTGVPLVTHDGITYDAAEFNKWQPGWTRGAGATHTVGIVFKPFTWLNIYANKSNSFRPSSPRQDIYFRRIPEEQGIGKDYGFSMNLVRDRLWMRFNKYSIKQLDAVSSPGRTFVNRLKRVDFHKFDSDSEPTLTNYYNLQRLAGTWADWVAARQGETWSEERRTAWIAETMRLPSEYLEPPKWTNGSSDDIVGKGYEFELNWNPSRTLALKFNFAKQETVNERISATVRQWYTERLAVWESIVDPILSEQAGEDVYWFTNRYEGENSAAQFLASDVDAYLDELYSTQGKSRPQIRKYRANLSAKFNFAGITGNPVLKGLSMTAAVRWEDRLAIGYYGRDCYKGQPLPGVVRELDYSRPIYDRARTHADIGFIYITRMFGGKVVARFQVDVRDVFENGHLQPIDAYPNGEPFAYRIVSPRTLIMSVGFDM